MSVIVDEDFSIMVASDVNHQELCAEIYFRGKFVALITHTNGKKVLELAGSNLDETVVARAVSLEGFLRAIDVALVQLAT